MKRKIRDVVDVKSLTLDYIEDISSSANGIYLEMLSGNHQRFSNHMSGKDCNMIFNQESTRTFDGFYKAFVCLGSRNIGGFRSGKESSMNKGESIFHTVDTYIGQGTSPLFIVMRDDAEGSAKWASICAFRSYAKKFREFAKKFRNFPHNLILPIIFNGGDGKHSHPSQLLLDCAMLKYRFGRIENFKIGEGYDTGGSRVVSSHIDAASILGWKMNFCHFPDAGLSKRQIYGLWRTGQTAVFYDSMEKMLPAIDLLYVIRYQFNLRNQKTGEHAAGIFTPEHPRISLELIKPFGLPIFHARPIDKNAQEIHPNLYDHPFDMSGIQSDFGVNARMAMCIYALENQMFSLEGIIRTLKPDKLGFYREDLNKYPSNSNKKERYTSSRLNNSVVIDHIPLGCGGVISNIISKLYPDIQIVLSMNIKGDTSESMPKDNIKLHVSESFAWTNELSNIVALFTDYTSDKSCRVSIFRSGYRTDKWCFRYIQNGGDICENPSCITNKANRENIHFFHEEDKCFDGTSVYVCPFCEWPQKLNEIDGIFLE